ncbi:hypothetical protein [Nannocystis pusilla]
MLLPVAWIDLALLERIALYAVVRRGAALRGLGIVGRAAPTPRKI